MSSAQGVAAVIPAAGRGERLKAGKPKPFVSILGKPLLAHTLLALDRAYRFTEIIVAADSSRLDETVVLLRKYGLRKVRVVAGGATRAESVRNGVLSISSHCQWVLIHDAARPLAGKALIRSILKGAQDTGAAICALPATATVKKTDPRTKLILATENRDELFLAQTPQVFRRDLLEARYQTLGNKALHKTDEAALFDGSAVKVKIVPGEISNLKITTSEDIALFRYYLKK